MKLEYSVREASENDAAELLKLFQEHAEYEKTAFDGKSKLEQLESVLNEPFYNCLVVETMDGIQGYLSYLKQFSSWDVDYYFYMDCLYLRSSIRNLGIGEILMTKLRDHAKSDNVSEIQWQTPDFNEGAIRFYHRIGAKSKNKKRFYWKV